MTQITKLNGLTIETFDPPPSGFDARVATDALLLQHGWPRRPAPDDSLSYREQWSRAFYRPLRYVVPEFKARPRKKRARRDGASPAGGMAGPLTTDNWSGSVARIPSPRQSFQRIIGTWTVPNPHAAADDGQWYYASQWVGIDGFGGLNVLQAGSETDAAYETGSQHRSVYLWFEWVPADQVEITNLIVEAGDVITCLLTVNSSTSGNVYIGNVSSGATTSFKVTAAAGSSLVGSSAEWIVEAPIEHEAQSIFANYGVVFFDGGTAAYATGAPGAGGASTSVEVGSGDLVTMLDANNIPRSIPTILGPTTMKVTYQTNANAPPDGVNFGIGVTTVDGNRPYAFLHSIDESYWLKWWSGSAWSWLDLGTYTLAGDPVFPPFGVGVTTVDGDRPYVFVAGYDGNLWLNWWSGSAWSWRNQMDASAPPGVSCHTGIGVTIVDGGRPYAFIRGNDGNVWLNWWSGSAWAWHDQTGNDKTAPPHVTDGIGVTTVDGSRPYAFVLGGENETDRNLWLNWWTGSTWAWRSQSDNTAPNSISIAVGVTTVDGSRPYVFVCDGTPGNVGSLWLNWWTGSTWAPWLKLSDATGPISIASAVGVTTVDGKRPYAFVVSGDGHLWLNWWNGAKWGWLDQGTPPGWIVALGIGVTVVDNDRPYAFVLASDNNLWVNWWTGSTWQWTNLG